MSAGVSKEGQAQLGFAWWTFSGWASLIVGSLYCLAQMKEMGGFAVALLVVNVILSTMIIKFSKTAFVIATVLSINPILWIINGIYIRNRWNDPRVMENKGAVEAEATRARAEPGGHVEQASEPWGSAAAPIPAKPSSVQPQDQVAASAPATAEVVEPSEEDMWAAAMAEEASTNRRQGLWAKCFGESGGVESAARAGYMAARVEEMKVEARAARKAAEDKRRAEEEERRLAHLNEEQRAYERLPKGECPNCDAVIPLGAVECPNCKAHFGAGSAWTVKPVT